ncbi:aminotransferase class I/II-fold pyridoxal phosphate-dependent enzyme [Rufibacter glacialis]|uniref:Aminotransferase class I/II-fold pyridoxal phosphate-dependent enzyme n=1 Tax=Rufibacter glacialis TaxID=1259555 RepID=A0A5M8Q717_9BACT|nr:aminotransferase class I/II-fold pyridoxal phosphate-dependent enzyme [Rufibacter glacialis]KAA6431677.1 aminotransferase class I/II-fold pyridoxal phosphate-dependent enzyme [Rufibacter glacialis]GGK82517.1 8-amino-7-oxononanoate synthase [Rufibacter glacialis]
MVPERLRRQLDARDQQGILRRLACPAPGLVDFSSNDYLGLATSSALAQAIAEEVGGTPAHGAAGSRLLSGNTQYAEDLEAEIAAFHGAEAALLFTSGYAANCGFFSSVPQRGDTIFYDEASHASIKEGIWLSFAQSFAFRHNNLDDLFQKLKRAQGDVYVAVESLYSMDGDFAPLTDLAALCQEKGLYLVVDEAHSNGLFGENGEGLVAALELEEQVFARIMTFGKAVGVHGAAIVGPKVLQQFLLNFSRPFIYTTALPLASLVAIRQAYRRLPGLTDEREQVQQLAHLYQTNISGTSQLGPLSGKGLINSPIQAWTLPDPVALRALSHQLQVAGFDVRPVFSPTVPAGKERLRLVLHAFNTPLQVQEVCSLLLQHIPKDIS